MTFLAKRQQVQFTLKKGFFINVAPITSNGWTIVYRVDNPFSIPKLVQIAKFNSTTKIGQFDSDLTIRILAGIDDVEYDIVDSTPVLLPPPDPSQPVVASPTLGISAAVQAELDKKAPLDANGKVPVANLPFDINGAVEFDKHYTHSQSISSATWAITHNMNKYPSINITTSAGDEVEGEVQYTGLNSLTIKFSAPFAGKAFLN